jgi:hypothetical protein
MQETYIIQYARPQYSSHHQNQVQYFQNNLAGFLYSTISASNNVQGSNDLSFFKQVKHDLSPFE